MSLNTPDGRRTIYYLGILVSIGGFLLFISSFIAPMKLDNFTAFSGDSLGSFVSIKDFASRGILGILIMAIGRLITKIRHRKDTLKTL